MMITRKPLVAAMAATGLCLSVGSVSAGVTYPLFSDLCGTTVESTTTHTCDYSNSETLTKKCEIAVGPDVDLTIEECIVDAGGNKVEITGDSDATLKLWNGSLVNASKIEVEFEGWDGDLPCTNHDIIDVEGYELRETGGGRKDGIKFSTECGNIDIDADCSYNNISVAGVFKVETDDGNIDLMDYCGYMSVSAPADGKIQIKAGGDGRVTSEGVMYQGGKIEINSEGGSSFVRPSY